MKTPLKQWFAGLAILSLAICYHADAKPLNEEGEDDFITTEVPPEPTTEPKKSMHAVETTADRHNEDGDGEVKTDPEVEPEPNPEPPPSGQDPHSASMVARVREYIANLNLSSIPLLSQSRLLSPVNALVSLCGDDLLDFENYDTATGGDSSLSEDSNGGASGGEGGDYGHSQEEDCEDEDGGYKMYGKQMANFDYPMMQYPPPPMMGGYYPGLPFPPYPQGYNPGFLPHPQPYGSAPESSENFPPPGGPYYGPPPPGGPPSYGPPPFPGLPYPGPLFPGPPPYAGPPPFPDILLSNLNKGSEESNSGGSQSKESPPGAYAGYPPHGGGYNHQGINHPGTTSGTGYYPSYGGMIPEANESGSFVSEQDTSEYSSSVDVETPVTGGYDSGGTSQPTGGKPPCRPRSKAIGSGRALLSPPRLHCRLFKNLLYRLGSARSKN